MKNVLLLPVFLLLISITSLAQKKMIIINHTACEWCGTVYMDLPNSTGPSTQVHNTTFATVIGVPVASTLNIIAPTTTWYDGAKFPQLYDPQWIWSFYELAPCMCRSNKVEVSGTDQGQSTYATSLYGSSVLDNNPCCGDNTITWTDLNNGDVQIDIY
ncbi:MAG: hypothetical protein JST36_05030 [Bacteroidetes bacterium]|nr:hypothetical protein [Bacteroidota bacterium]